MSSGEVRWCATLLLVGAVAAVVVTWVNGVLTVVGPAMLAVLGLALHVWVARHEARERRRREDFERSLSPRRRE